MEAARDERLIPHVLPRWDLPQLDEDDEVFLLTIPEGVDVMNLPPELLLPIETETSIEVVKDGLVYTSTTVPTSGTRALLFNGQGTEGALDPHVLETTTSVAVMPLLTPTTRNPVEYPLPSYSWPGVAKEEFIFEQQQQIQQQNHHHNHNHRRSNSGSNVNKT